VRVIASLVNSAAIDRYYMPNGREAMGVPFAATSLLIDAMRAKFSWLRLSVSCFKLYLTRVDAYTTQIRNEITNYQDLPTNISIQLQLAAYQLQQGASYLVAEELADGLLVTRRRQAQLESTCGAGQHSGHGIDVNGCVRNAQ
jgi:hypothetical protein